jgi:hypothetical protein
MNKELKDLYKIADKIFENKKIKDEESRFNRSFSQISDALAKLNDIVNISKKSLNSIWNLSLHSGYFYNKNVEKIKSEYILDELSTINKRIGVAYERTTSYIDFHKKNLINKKSKSRRFSQQDVVQELICLKEEYGERFGISKQDKFIFLITDNIILEDENDVSYDFGQFRIELYYDEHKHYFVKALQPLCHRTNDHYTHPHISCDKLCEGDATEAIAISLAEGRLTDFFDLINSILKTYNPRSPYSPLETWLSGDNCYECGSELHEESICTCNLCGSSDVYCNDCMYYCDSCNEYVCSDHFVRCSECSSRFCEECMSTCDVCGIYLCSDCRCECEHCGKNLCGDCSYTCNVCEDCICSRCYNKCNQCENITCKRCLNDCNCCSEEICDNCKKTCKDCDETICESCSSECSYCGDVICKDCLNECEKCSNVICKEHSFSCGKCEKVNCDECNKKCEGCEENLCQNCSCDCCSHKEESVPI